MRSEISDYFKKNYDSNVTLKDFESKNLGFDVVATHKNLNLLIEYKGRFFESGKTDQFLKEYDILVEIIQSLPVFQKLPISISNRDVNNLITSHKLNVAVGWFYKCIADRLVFFRFLDNELYDVIDLDFRFFKQWLMNEINNFSLQYSDKTTGTINLKIPLNRIPKPFLKYKQS